VVEKKLIIFNDKALKVARLKAALSLEERFWFKSNIRRKITGLQPSLDLHAAGGKPPSNKIGGIFNKASLSVAKLKQKFDITDHRVGREQLEELQEALLVANQAFLASPRGEREAQKVKVEALEIVFKEAKVLYDIERETWAG